MDLWSKMPLNQPRTATYHNLFLESRMKQMTPSIIFTVFIGDNDVYFPINITIRVHMHI